MLKRSHVIYFPPNSWVELDLDKTLEVLFTFQCTSQSNTTPALITTSVLNPASTKAEYLASQRSCSSVSINESLADFSSLN